MANKAIDKAYLITQLKNYETSIVDTKYVAKETGKGLSTNDYTTAEKEKLAGMETYVASQITGAEHLKRSIVDTVPGADSAQDNIIYMVKVADATGNDKYQEYQKINGVVELIGDTSVDLSNYYSKTETLSKTEIETAIETSSNESAQAALNNFYKKNETYTKTEIDSLVANGVTFETENIDFATEY